MHLKARRNLQRNKITTKKTAKPIHIHKKNAKADAMRSSGESFLLKKSKTKKIVCFFQSTWREDRLNDLILLQKEDGVHTKNIYIYIYRISK